MTNAELIANLTRRNIQRIEAKMSRGIPFANALHQARQESVGGPAVWEAVEAHFNELFDGMDSTL